MNRPKDPHKAQGILILVTLCLALLSWIAAIVLVGVLTRSFLYAFLALLAAAASLFGLYKYMVQPFYEKDFNSLTVLMLGIGLALGFWVFYKIHHIWVWGIVGILLLIPLYLERQSKIREDRRMDIHLYGKPQTDADRIARANQATNMREYASALGLNYIPASGPVIRPRHASQFAASLNCVHCSERQAAREWPANGDAVPFYFQKEPGKFTLKLVCPKCGKDWYVAWDQDPGQILPLS